MNSSGVVLALVGVWVLAQVIGGDALPRLGIGGDLSAQRKPDTAPTKPAPGAPVVDRSARATVGGGTWA